MAKESFGFEEALTNLGFTLTVSDVVGQPKKFWRKGNYWFSACGVSEYQLVGPNDEVKKFSTRKRIKERADAEIIEKLTKWLEIHGDRLE